jgi:hypothetical protein
MKNEIKLLKNNDERTDSDLEWVDEFYQFLQGVIPESIHVSRGHKVKLSPKKAMSIIWYLQEHFPVLTDTIESCHNCKGLFDSANSGIYWETKGRHYCGGCDHLVPENYDKGKR